MTDCHHDSGFLIVYQGQEEASNRPANHKGQQLHSTTPARPNRTAHNNFVVSEWRVNHIFTAIDFGESSTRKAGFAP